MHVTTATTAKLALEHNLDLELATALASSANQTLRLVVYPVFVLLLKYEKREPITHVGSFPYFHFYPSCLKA